MKNRVFCIVLTLGILLSLAAPAVAAAEQEPTSEPEYRLTSVSCQRIHATEPDTYSFTYDNGGYLPTKIKEASAFNETETVISYDENGRVMSYQRSGQHPHTYLYDKSGKLLEETEMETMVFYNPELDRDIANDFIYTYTYDEEETCTGYKKTIIDEDGGEESLNYEYEYTYDGAGRIAARSELCAGKLLNTTTYTYDDGGRLLEETREEPTGDGNLISYYQYYWMPLLEGIWERASNDWGGFSLFLRDAAGRPICRLCYSDLYEEFGEPTLTYDDNGYLVKMDDGNGCTIALTYEPVA